MLAKNFLYQTKYKTSDILLAHLFICIIGVIGCVFRFIYLFYPDTVMKKNLFIPYTEWAKMTLEITKPIYIFGYIANLVIIISYFIFTALVYTCVKNNSWKVNFSFLKEKNILLIIY